MSADKSTCLVTGLRKCGLASGSRVKSARQLPRTAFAPKRRWGAAAALLLVLSQSSLAFGTGVSHHTTHTPSFVDLKLKVFGYIKPHCEISLPDEKLWFDMTDDADMKSVAFDLNCNQPLKVEVSSLNGGLKHEAHSRLADYAGFTSFIEYDLDLALQTAGTRTLRFDSEDIKDAPGRGHFGVIPHETTGDLQIRWSPTETLIAGTYGDVIEIRVTGDSGLNGHW